jgi:hypothetical protein
MMGQPLVLKGAYWNQPKQGWGVFWRPFRWKKGRERRKLVRKRPKNYSKRPKQDTRKTYKAGQTT